ncbi:MAG: 3'-5' exonuclease [Opitutales bacterium]
MESPLQTENGEPRGIDHHDLPNLDGLPERISKEAINALPLIRYQGPVHLINEPDAVDGAVEAISREPVVGFDTETRPVFRKGQSYPTSLIQMATAEAVYLFQLNRLNGLDGVLDLLTREDILKVGVALRDDFIKLQEIERFKQQGVVDIADVTLKLGLVNTGLRALTAVFLHGRISKAAQVSNWGKHELSPSQITYAATDAWVSRELYVGLQRMGVLSNKHKPGTPPTKPRN